MIAGRYTLGREIGRGGMGAVWLARDEVLHRDVAVKRVGMVPGGSSPHLERAAREARLAAALNHPHVVAVFDLVHEGDERWLVMEYVPGLTLATLIARDGPLTPERAAPLLGQAADALAAAHEVGIVHRDVKPSNMLVTLDGRVKLSDFGIARATADLTLTQTGMVTGSPAYLAPEVASGHPATGASDVWSLGATAFHALSGRPPYETDGNLLGALYRVVHDEPPRLEHPGSLAPLMAHTMTRDPEDRWSMATVRDFLADRPTADTHPLAIPVSSPPASESPEPTAVLTQAAARPPAPAAPVAAAAPPDAAPPTGAPSGGAPRSPRGLITLVVVLAVLLVASLGWAVLRGGDNGAADEAGSTAASSQTSRDSTPSQSSPGPTAGGMRTFIDDYLAAATSDQKTSWAMLTPSFQDASGGYGSYHKFWKDHTSATLGSFSADPDGLTVEYDVRYTLKDGSTALDQVRLNLVFEDGTYLIDGES